MPTLKQETPSTEATVYFDGTCSLCTWEIRHYRKLDRQQKINFVDVSGQNSKVAPDLDRDTAMARFHVRNANGELHSGAKGFVTLWAALPFWRHLAPIAGHRWSLPWLERAYGAFLRIRPHLSAFVNTKAQQRARQHLERTE